MMSERDDGAWFLPKRYGYGSGWPIAIFISATLGLAYVSARKTRGGWHWRWGGGD